MAASDAAKPDLDALQEALDYRFEDANLLIRAITHRSSLPGGGDDPSLSYQRLEFMGCLLYTSPSPRD